jgi:hypothetical protein
MSNELIPRMISVQMQYSLPTSQSDDNAQASDTITTLHFGKMCMSIRMTAICRHAYKAVFQHGIHASNAMHRNELCEASTYAGKFMKFD